MPSLASFYTVRIDTLGSIGGIIGNKPRKFLFHCGSFRKKSSIFCVNCWIFEEYARFLRDFKRISYFNTQKACNHCYLG